MKKEVFLAVFVGFALGLVITFGIWTANKSLQSQSPAVSPTPVAVVTPAPTTSPSQTSLTMTSPEDEALLTANTTSVSGKTLANIPVVVTSETDQIIIVSDSTGAFTTDVKLEGGYNRIFVTVFDPSGNSTTKQLLITYTTSKI